MVEPDRSVGMVAAVVGVPGIAPVLEPGVDGTLLGGAEGALL